MAACGTLPPFDFPQEKNKIKFISLPLLTFFRAEVEAYPAVSWSTSVPPHSAVLNGAICIHRWQARAHNSL